jgi:truncated hemoglobin YjbI
LNAVQEALRLGTCIDSDLAKQYIPRVQKLVESGSVTKAPIIKAPAMEYSSNIYTKFGGRPRFEKLARAVHEAMFVHPSVSYFFPPTMNNERITQRNVDFLVGAFGGPKYQGPDMVITHEFLRITDSQYNVMMECYHHAMQKMNIEGQFRVPIVRQLEGMRSSIVYRPDRPKPLARKFAGHLEMHKRDVSNDKKKVDKNMKARKPSIKPEKKEMALHQEGKTAVSVSGPSDKDASAESAPADKDGKVRERRGSFHAVLAAIKLERMRNLMGEGCKDHASESESATATTCADSQCASPRTASEVDSCFDDNAHATDRCPVSGKQMRGVYSSQTCPFMAMLMRPSAEGGKPSMAALLQPLESGRVALVDPHAHPASSEFGVLSM